VALFGDFLFSLFLFPFSLPRKIMRLRGVEWDWAISGIMFFFPFPFFFFYPALQGRDRASRNAGRVGDAVFFFFLFFFLSPPGQRRLGKELNDARLRHTCSVRIFFFPVSPPPFFLVLHVIRSVRRHLGRLEQGLFFSLLQDTTPTKCIVMLEGEVVTPRAFFLFFSPFLPRLRSAERRGG